MLNRLLIAAFCVLSAPVFAQSLTKPVQPISGPVAVAATEKSLWLAAGVRSDVQLFHRTPASPFDLGRSLGSRVLMLAPRGDDVLAVFGDGTMMSYGVDIENERVERILPGKAVPLDLIAAESKVYALVDAAVAAQLEPAARPSDDAAASRDSGLAVAVLELEWSSLGRVSVPIRARQSPELGPRLGWARDRLLVVWSEGAGGIRYSVNDPAAGSWSAPVTLEAPPLKRVWITTVDGVAIIAAQIDDAGDPMPVRAWRLLGELGEGASAWKPSKLVWSLPTGAPPPARLLSAFGFNQHLGLLASDQDGTPQLHFARFGAPPTEPSYRVAQAFEHVERISSQYNLFQLGTWLVLVLVIVGLFTLRRDAVSRDVDLPPGLALAFVFQRVIGWAVDFVPFTVAGAAILRISWIEGVGVLVNWVVSPSMQNILPSGRILLWWGVSVGAYVIYCIIIETLTARSLGKWVTGTRIMSETREPLRFDQVVIRNALRLIELLPPFWVFGFLILLSRNSQRLGDIFGRTVVVRTANDETQSPADPGDDTPGGGT